MDVPSPIPCLHHEASQPTVHKKAGVFFFLSFAWRVVARSFVTTGLWMMDDGLWMTEPFGCAFRLHEVRRSHHQDPEDGTDRQGFQDAFLDQLFVEIHLFVY